MWERIPLIKIFITLLVVFLLLLILGVRFPARSQDLPLEQWIEVVRAEINRITGEEVTAKTLGSTEGNSAIIDLLASTEDSFIIKQGERHFVFSIGQIPNTEGSRSIEAIQIALRSSSLVEGEIYQVVSFLYGSNVSYVFFPETGSPPVGTLIELSREYIPQKGYSPVSATGCSSWIPLTLNILRKPAEQIQICARALCVGSVPTACAITSINREVGLFAELDTSPSPPSDMTVVGSNCIADTNFQISYLNFSINALVFQMNSKFEVGGSLESHLDCSGTVSILDR